MKKGLQWLALYSVLGLFTAAHAAPPIDPNLPDWLKKELRKETKVRGSKALEFDDMAIKLQSPGRLDSQPEKEGDFWFWTIKVRKTDPMQCWVSTIELDPAAFTMGIADNLIGMLAEVNGPEVQRSIYQVDVSHNEGTPIYHLDWLPMFKSDNGSVAGMVKVRTAQWPGATLTCAHAVLGYFDTFDTAFADMVASAQVPQTLDAYYNSLHTVSFGGQKVGFATLYLDKDADGDSRLTNLMSMMIPVDNKTIAYSDIYRINWSTPAGLLINEYTVTSENGQVSNELNLNWKDGGWQVEGTFQGKALKTTLPEQSNVWSDLGQMQHMKEQGAAGAFESTTYPMWSPDIDPTTFTQVKLEPKGEGVAMTIGPIVTDATVSAEGGLQRGDTDMGGTSMVLDMVYERGAVPLPPAE